MTDRRLTALAAALPASVPFVGPETQERARGRPFRARIGANEIVLGPSPRAIDAMRAAAPDAWMYGDSACLDLRTALAARITAMPLDSIVVGEGIDGLLGYLVRLFVAPGDAVVTSAGAYPTFNYHVTGYGGAIHTVPYRDDREDPGALVAKAAETGAQLIYIANPDNPMGSWHDAGAMARMIAQVPDGSLLVLDEAYAEFAPEPTAPAPDPDDRRVIRMRTFSKAYGLAGAARRLRARATPTSSAPSTGCATISASGGWRRRRRWRRCAMTDGLLRSASAMSRPVPASVASPPRTGSPRCPRPPISSPSIAAGTARSAGASWRNWPTGMSLCACPSPPRRTAASGSAAAPGRICRCSRTPCPKRLPPRRTTPGSARREQGDGALRSFNSRV